MLQPLKTHSYQGAMLPDSLLFQRAKTYDRTPLFK
jgi:hypothetical protein